MTQKIQQSLFKLVIIFCVVIYAVDIYLIVTSPNALKIRNLFESSFSYPIYVSNTIDSYLRQVQPPLEPKKAYTIAFVGDSMTEYLKPGQDKFRDKLQEYYKGRDFVIYNYGFGSTNILSVEDRLRKDISYSGQNYPAILGQQYDLIFLESFGHNPLSDVPLEEGKRKQTRALNRIMKLLRDKKPRSFVVFMSTVSPNKDDFGKGTIELNAEQRAQWVKEREEYLKNHITYAKSHSIPHINLSDRSDANLFSAADHIHPSPAGVKFILDKIAEEIYNQRIIPL